MLNTSVLKKRCLIMNVFSSAQFSYCSLICMFFIRSSNYKMNRLHEQCIHIVSNENSHPMKNYWIQTVLFQYVTGIYSSLQQKRLKSIRKGHLIFLINYFLWTQNYHAVSEINKRLLQGFYIQYIIGYII